MLPFVNDWKKCSSAGSEASREAGFACGEYIAEIRKRLEKSLIAADKSIQWGYAGAMHGFAANKELLEHYINTFHAEFLGMLHDYQFFVNEIEAKKLLEVYNYEWN